jgi:hypothetical protein
MAGIDWSSPPPTLLPGRLPARVLQKENQPAASGWNRRKVSTRL